MTGKKVRGGHASEHSDWMLQNGALHSLLRPSTESLALDRDLTTDVALIQQRSSPGPVGETDHKSAKKKTQK